MLLCHALEPAAACWQDRRVCRRSLSSKDREVRLHERGHFVPSTVVAILAGYGNSNFVGISRSLSCSYWTEDVGLYKDVGLVYNQKTLGRCWDIDSPQAAQSILIGSWHLLSQPLDVPPKTRTTENKSAGKNIAPMEQQHWWRLSKANCFVSRWSDDRWPVQ